MSSYRYPAAPGPLGVTQRLAGPEQVFRFVIRGRIANAGAVVVSQAAGSHVSPRLVRAGSEDRLAGYPALPLRINPYQPGYFGLIPAVGVFRPAPGTYDLVFDTPSRRAAGRFAFRFWVNDTTPPAARLLSRTVARGKLLLLRVSDRGSGVDPATMLAKVDGSYRRLIWDKAHGLAGVRIPTLASGTPQARLHRLRLPGGEEQRERRRDAAEHAHAHRDLRGALVPAVEVFDRRQLVEVSLDARGELVGLAAQDAQL